MIRWPLRRSRGNSTDGRAPAVTGTREPKKSILRTKRGDNDQYNHSRGFYNNSASMIDIRSPSAPKSVGHPAIYDSVTSDFTAGRSTREKRSVLFLDQLVGSRQMSLDGTNNGNSHAERLGTGPTPSFSSYPASYQASPTTVRREENVPDIQLISSSVLMSRRESLDGINSEGNSVGNRFTLRPSLPWNKKKAKKPDSTHSDYYSTMTSNTFSGRRTDRGSISGSSTNLRMEYGPIDKLALDKSTFARAQHSGYNNTVSGAYYNPTSKPPLPLSIRDVSMPITTWNVQPRMQDTRVGNNQTFDSYSPRKGNSSTPSHRAFSPYQFSVHSKPPSPSLGNAWIPYSNRSETYLDKPTLSGEQAQIISRPRVHNTLVELQQPPTESSMVTRGARRRVTLAYPPVDSLSNGRTNGVRNHSGTVTPDTPRVIEINRF